MSSPAPTQRSTAQPVTPPPIGWLSASLISQALLFLIPARRQYDMNVLPFILMCLAIFCSGASIGVLLAAWRTLRGGIRTVLLSLLVLPSLAWISVSIQGVGAAEQWLMDHPSMVHQPLG